ncbi:extracellular solute-binding protein [Carnobacterium gallinarum]|uniref:extracellular solute-binding protein n=1 Tax=Carnobacterium gallinarum TaxID=2749 RepID=UPI0005516C25|nr:extracellular solute-binding protein [Carnobacterium gallinarum]
MKRKRGIKITIGLLVCTVILTACSGGAGGTTKSDGKKDIALNTKSEFPVVTEELKMTMMGQNTGLAEWKDMPTLIEYAKKTGIDFDYITPPMSDFGTKLNLAFASGDLPDVIFGSSSNELTPAMEMDYGAQGILLPLEGYIDEYMPNFKKLLDADPSILKSITTPDGHIYTLPMISTGATAIWPRGPMWYRGDWLEKLNVKELPKTTDEFYTLLKRFRDEDPNGNGKADEIPLTDVKMDSTRPWLMAAFGMKTRGIEEHDGKVSYSPISENYKAYLEFMNKLYSEKLLDQEVYGQADEQKKSKGQNNEIGLFPDWSSFFTTGKTEEEALGDPMFQPLSSKWSPETIVPGSPKMTRATFAITNKNPSPEASLRWVDYFYSEEGSEYLNNGPENAFWKWATNDAGEKVRVYADNVDKKKLEDERGKVTPNYGLTVPTVGIDLKPEQTIRMNANDKPNVLFTEWVNKETSEKITPYAEVAFPLVYLTKEESDKVRDTTTDLTAYVEQMEAKFITGVEPLSKWDDYVKTINSMGIKEYVATYQEAYDRWADTK